jgi:predicted ribosome quality control (RQC) complex YloA/Tae2 family protein
MLKKIFEIFNFFNLILTRFNNSIIDCLTKPKLEHIHEKSIDSRKVKSSQDDKRERAQANPAKLDKEKRNGDDDSCLNDLDNLFI